MACLGLRQVVFLGEKLMLLPALHLLWTWSEPHPSAKCRACWHWLKNTQINFLWGKKWDPLFSSLRSDDAIDFIVEPEKRGSGGFMEPRERTLEKKMWFLTCLHTNLKRSSGLGLTSPFYLIQWLTLKTRSHHESLQLLLIFHAFFILSYCLIRIVVSFGLFPRP